MATTKTKPTTAEYEQLGRAIEGALITDYIELLGNPRRQLWMSFVRGVAAGLGSVIGATVVVAILVWILHSFGGLPVIGHWLQNTGTQIQK